MSQAKVLIKIVLLIGTLLIVCYAAGPLIPPLYGMPLEGCESKVVRLQPHVTTKQYLAMLEVCKIK